MGRKRMMSAGELEQRMTAYFENCDRRNGEDEKKFKKPYSLSGLLCELELTRAEFESMGNKRRYAKVIQRALARIEAFTEESALIGAISASAAANSLKYNFGWGSGTAGHASEEGARSIRIVLDEDMMRLAE